jgi:hypothetical protein
LELGLNGIFLGLNGIDFFGLLGFSILQIQKKSILFNPKKIPFNPNSNYPPFKKSIFRFKPTNFVRFTADFLNN